MESDSDATYFSPCAGEIGTVKSKAKMRSKKYQAQHDCAGQEFDKETQECLTDIKCCVQEWMSGSVPLDQSKAEEMLNYVTKIHALTNNIVIRYSIESLMYNIKSIIEECLNPGSTSSECEHENTETVISEKHGEHNESDCEIPEKRIDNDFENSPDLFSEGSVEDMRTPERADTQQWETHVINKNIVSSEKILLFKRNDHHAIPASLCSSDSIEYTQVITSGQPEVIDFDIIFDNNPPRGNHGSEIINIGDANINGKSYESKYNAHAENIEKLGRKNRKRKSNTNFFMAGAMQILDRSSVVKNTLLRDKISKFDKSVVSAIANESKNTSTTRSSQRNIENIDYSMAQDGLTNRSATPREGTNIPQREGIACIAEKNSTILCDDSQVALLPDGEAKKAGTNTEVRKSTREENFSEIPSSSKYSHVVSSGITSHTKLDWIMKSSGYKPLRQTLNVKPTDNSKNQMIERHTQNLEVNSQRINRFSSEKKSAPHRDTFSNAVSAKTNTGNTDQPKNTTKKPKIMSNIIVREGSKLPKNSRALDEAEETNDSVLKSQEVSENVEISSATEIKLKSSGRSAATFSSEINFVRNAGMAGWLPMEEVEDLTKYEMVMNIWLHN